MSETTTKAPRRTAKEIAQAHADKAVAALEKHDEKIAKAAEKVEAATAAHAQLVEDRRNLEREADYRQAHPLLAEETADVEQPQLEVVDAEKQDEYNPFA